MTESEAMQSIVNPAAIQAATAVVMGLREADAGPRAGINTASLREVHKDKADQL